MASLWKDYNSEYEVYEHNHPLAFPWNKKEREDVARYVRGDDGYWYDPEANETGRALISCTGDLMCEPRMTNACKYGDAYFFHPIFKYVRDVLKKSDFSIGNLETTLSDSTPYAGEYHRINRQFHCNGPECYLDAVRYAGFDALVTANNHTCDSGVTGIYDTLSALDRRDFMHTGTYRKGDDERVLFIKINGIRCAVISYATRYNAHDERNFTELGINSLLNYYSKEKIDRDTAHARERGAEFIICYIHWGVDYDLVPGERQLSVLATLKDADVDYIVGSHTHCLQAHSAAVSSNGREIPMMFSMGNFVTNESKELCKHTGILQLLLSRDNGRIKVKEYFVPCYVFDEFHGASFTVVPTSPMLNGGYSTEKLTRVEEYVRERVGDSIEFLPIYGFTLSRLAEAVGAEIKEEDAYLPVTKLCTEVGPSCRGAVCFLTRDVYGYERKELERRALTAVVSDRMIEGFRCLVVPDVRDAFVRASELASQCANPATRIAIAGGEGKTVAREMISGILSTAYSVLDVKDDYHIDTTPWQSAHPYHDVCLMELRDEALIGAGTLARSMQPDICVITSVTDGLCDIISSLKDGCALVVCGDDANLMNNIAKIDTGKLKVVTFGRCMTPNNMPFSDMSLPVSAAVKVGEILGISSKLAYEAIEEYRLRNYTQNVVNVDGATLVLRLNAKSENAALAAVDALSETSGRKLAVLGSISDGADLNKIASALRDAGAECIFANLKATGGNEITADGIKIVTVANERELELAVLEMLSDGDSLLVCGSRDSGLSTFVRRVFGVFDGYIPNSEYWTSPEKLEY